MLKNKSHIAVCRSLLTIVESERLERRLRLRGLGLSVNGQLIFEMV